MTFRTKPIHSRPCLAPGCTVQGCLARGLCQTHYGAAAYRVRLGEVTWRELERRGHARAPLYGGAMIRAKAPAAPCPTCGRP